MRLQSQQVPLSFQVTFEVKLTKLASFTKFEVTFEIQTYPNLSKLTNFNSNGREAYIRNWGLEATSGATEVFPERRIGPVARGAPWLGDDAEFAPNAWEGYDYAEWQRQHPHLNRLSHVGDVALALGGTALAANWIRSMHMSTDKARDDATKNTPYNPETQSLAPSPIEEPYHASRQQTQRVD